MSEPSSSSGPEPAGSGGRFGTAGRRKALVGAGLAVAVLAIGWFVARPLLTGPAAPAAAGAPATSHQVAPAVGSPSAAPSSAAPVPGVGVAAGTDPFAALYVPPTASPAPVATSAPAPVPSSPGPAPATSPAGPPPSGPAPSPTRTTASPTHTPTPAPTTPASHAVELLSVAGSGGAQQWTITVDGTPFTVKLNESFDHGFVVFRYSGDVPTLRYGNEAFDLPLGVVYHT